VRRPDWQARLWAELEGAQGRRFAYGSHDCVRLTAACLDAMLVTGGYLEAVSELYADKRRALRLVMREGIERLVTMHLGAPVPRNLARQGDVCLADLAAGPSLGICTGPRIAFAANPAGVSYLHLAIASHAWRVD